MKDVSKMNALEYLQREFEDLFGRKFESAEKQRDRLRVILNEVVVRCKHTIGDSGYHPECRQLARQILEVVLKAK